MNAEGKYLTPGETQRLQRDLRQMLDQCDTMFTEIAHKEQANVDNLRSAFQMMADMGYTADEAKDEFARFQAKYNADRNQGQQPLRLRVKSSHSRPTNKRAMSGVKRYNQAFLLCLVVIPILFVVGAVTEIWFYYNPWGRAFFNVRYGKAVLYLITWYMLLAACLPKTVAKVLTVTCCFAGIGMVLSCEPVINTIGIDLFGSAWIPFWVKLQWWYWGLLALTYLYAVWKLGHGPRYWIMKYGVGKTVIPYHVIDLLLIRL